MSQASERDVVVIGCGAIGLPLAVALAGAGAAVLGIDRDAAKAANLGAGRLELIDAGLGDALREGLATGRLAFAPTLVAADHGRAYVIATPTPASAAGVMDKGPLEGALADIAGVARAGDLVCVRSTVPIGATRALARAFAPLGLAFAACPDRSLAGQAYAEQFTVPHIVGGLGDEAGARAEALFAQLGAVVRTPDPETAEAIKLFANVERDVTFALANQFALICEATGVDFAGVRSAGAAGFRRFALARPGPVGGPCLTKDLSLLLASRGVDGVDTGLLSAARATRTAWPARSRSSFRGGQGRPWPSSGWPSRETRQPRIAAAPSPKPSPAGSRRVFPGSTSAIGTRSVIPARRVVRRWTAWPSWCWPMSIPLSP
jgi:nucleotide sugar dehydrogenase